MNQTWINSKEPSFGHGFVEFDPNSFRLKFFSTNLASSVTRCHGQLSSCRISENTNNPILRKLIDRQTEGQTKGQTDRRTRVICPVNIEHRILDIKKSKIYYCEIKKWRK